ncbi:MAG TPA: hypothetical protein VKC64_00190 [Burkholderiales bacterium]|nr:hypothetical protein [Burkholderiales bacterium]
MSTAADLRVRAARATLEQRLFARPEVRLVDIARERPAGVVVLRVHLASGADDRALGIPEEVDGIPVRIVPANHRPS